jgi:single-stranded-DNA-specific exonuclease
MSSQWFIYPPDYSLQRSLAEPLGIGNACAQALINRGVKTAEAARYFLEPTIEDIPDPFIFPDMEKAVLRITSAIKNREKIAIYGDYDVDGISGCAILYRFFETIGIEPIVYIPSRLSEGYGLNLGAVGTLAKQGVKLIITVDCGTRSLSEVKEAKKQGVDIIVTDHHETQKTPSDQIVINPKRDDFEFDDKNISGCAIAYFLAEALKKHQNSIGMLVTNAGALDSLDLVSLGTIADVVPLTGLNRLFAKLGLKMAAASKKAGIRALIKTCGLKDTPLKTGHVAFRIVPRINAAGRLGDASLSLKLLTTGNQETAEDIANQLEKLNALRQGMEEKVLNEAADIIERAGLGSRPAIVVSSDKWHPGVIGIVASKLAERYLVPAVVITFANGSGRGSARSVPHVNIVQILDKASHLLERYGGHAQAAGLSIHVSKVREFQKAFERSCEETGAVKKPPELTVDAAIPAEDLTPSLAREIEMLEPFGLGNPEPVFCVNDFTVAEQRIVGANHLKIKLMHIPSRNRFDSIGFGMKNKMIETGSTVKVAFTPQMNFWNGLASLQLKIKDIICTK